MRRRGWPWFWLWAIPGVALGFQVSVIGFLFVLPGLIVALLLGRFVRGWPEPLGVAAGLGLTCLTVALIAVLNGDWPGACPPSGEVVTRTATSVAGRSCHRWSAVPWTVAGVVLLGGAA